MTEFERLLVSQDSKQAQRTLQSQDPHHIISSVIPDEPDWSLQLLCRCGWISEPFRLGGPIRALDVKFQHLFEVCPKLRAERERIPEAQRKREALECDYKAFPHPIILDGVKEIFAVEQGGRCAICLDKSSQLQYDHNHITWEHRSLLCRRCNLAVGFVERELWFAERPVENEPLDDAFVSGRLDRRKAALRYLKERPWRSSSRVLAWNQHPI